MSDRRESSGPVAWPLALVLTTVGFLALTIAGLGIGSLVADADVIAAPDLGPVPGPLAVAGSAAAFALVTWQAVRLIRPRFTAVIGVTIAAYLAYGIVAGIGALRDGLARFGVRRRRGNAARVAGTGRRRIRRDRVVERDRARPHPRRPPEVALGTRRRGVIAPPRQFAGPGTPGNR